MRIETLSQLGHPVSYYAKIGRAVGGANAGVLLCQLMYWSGNIDGKFRGHDTDGWVYKSQEQIEEETALTRREQETARKRLRKLGILEEKHAPRPTDWRQVLWFRVRPEVFDRLFDEFEAKSLDGGKRHPRMAESAIQGSTNPPSKEGGKRHAITETTSETTSETTPEETETETETETVSIWKVFVDGGLEELKQEFIVTPLVRYARKFPAQFLCTDDPDTIVHSLLCEQLQWRTSRRTIEPAADETIAAIKAWFQKRYRDPENPSYALADVQYHELCNEFGIDECRRSKDFNNGRFHDSLRQLFESLCKTGASLDDYRKWLHKNRRLSISCALQPAFRQSFCAQFKNLDLVCSGDTD
jgi:hypothetical protein